jgi:hypothetical protein
MWQVLTSPLVAKFCHSLCGKNWLLMLWQKFATRLRTTLLQPAVNNNSFWTTYCEIMENNIYDVHCKTINSHNFLNEICFNWWTKYRKLTIRNIFWTGMNDGFNYLKNSSFLFNHSVVSSSGSRQSNTCTNVSHIQYREEHNDQSLKQFGIKYLHNLQDIHDQSFGWRVHCSKSWTDNIRTIENT